MTLLIERADITQQSTDAIVNAANSYLRHGGGVARAIADAAGETLTAESVAHEFIEVGDAGYTTAGALPCDWVIHAVGPRWSGGTENEPALLASAYRSAMRVAAQLGCKTVAFPSISTGIFGFPIERGAPIAVSVIAEELAASPTVELVRFCLFHDEDMRCFEAALRNLPPANR